MSESNQVLRMTVGGAVCGSFLGIFGGGVIGGLIGALFTQVSLGLDGALCGGGIGFLGGALFGAFQAFWDRQSTAVLRPHDADDVRTTPALGRRPPTPWHESPSPVPADSARVHPEQP